MLIKRLSITGAIFVIFFILQESLINQLTLPAGGFSIFIILTLLWASLSTAEIGAATGFGAGLLLDLSPSTNGPLGHWTLILLLVGFVISYFSYGDENMRGNPLSLILIVTIAYLFLLVAYIGSGFLFGLSATNFQQTLITIFGSSLWTLAITPLMLPSVIWLHDLAFEARIRI
jgi:rod shape-determining protein MreD